MAHLARSVSAFFHVALAFMPARSPTCSAGRVFEPCGFSPFTPVPSSSSLTSAGGATEVSPARERWDDRVRKNPERRRRGTPPLFTSSLPPKDSHPWPSDA
jgi:hypothetical protein